MFVTIWIVSVITNLAVITFMVIYFFLKHADSTHSVMNFLRNMEDKEDNNYQGIIPLIIMFFPITSTVFAIANIINFPYLCKEIDKMCDDDNDENK